MPWQLVDPEQEQAKRELRLRIGRLRRQIDRRLRAAQRHGRRLLSWRTYVTRFPGYAIVGALGAGMVVSAGSARRRLTRWLGLRLVRRASDQLSRALWRELRQIWADATPEKPDRTTSSSDEGAGPA